MIDSAEYGYFSITKPISIVAVGIVAGVSSDYGLPAIAVNISNAKVSIKGLTVASGAPNTSGIIVYNASDVDISDCHIAGFTAAGVDIQSNALTRVHIYNTEITQNNYGVEVAAGGAANGAVIENSSLDYNTGGNIYMDGVNGAVLVGGSSLQGGPALVIASGTTASVQSYGDNRVSGSFPATIVQRQ